MAFSLPSLPYAPDAFGPLLSAESFDYHYGKHHQAYVDKANELMAVAGGFDGMSLESACFAASKDPATAVLFNQLGQHYNHSLYWQSIKPDGGGNKIPEKLTRQIDADFGGFAAFRNQFIQTGLTQFGSGWAWLCLDNATGKLGLSKTPNADTPLVRGQTPLFVCDVWEHAYYIDYRNARAKFLETFIDHLINWENVELLFEAGPVKIAA